MRSRSVRASRRPLLPRAPDFAACRSADRPDSARPARDPSGNRTVGSRGKGGGVALSWWLPISGSRGATLDFRQAQLNVAQQAVAFELCKVGALVEGKQI